MSKKFVEIKNLLKIRILFDFLIENKSINNSKIIHYTLIYAKCMQKIRNRFRTYSSVLIKYPTDFH